MKPKPQQHNAVRGTTARIGEERLVRLTHQNEKLKIEVQRLRGEVGPVEQFRQEVIKCNTTAKLQILAAPIREGPALGLTREQIDGITQALVDACNDLAYENLHPVGTCPTCGSTLKGEPL